VLGHNPYVMTPNQLQHSGDPIGKLAIQLWRFRGSLYGPLATAEQWAAARLGGTSATRIIFWLKLWNAIVFLGVAYGLDRMLRSDPARRVRAHLLWTVNPLLLWGVVEGGHLDLLAAAASFFALALVRSRRAEGESRPAGPSLLVALAAGALVGVAVDFMLTYVLLAAALAWALRRWPAALLAAAAGFLVAFAPAYLAVGRPLVNAMEQRRGKVSADNFYQLFNRAYQHPLPSGPDLLIVLAVVVLAVLLLWRLPDAVPDLPAIQPALAIAIAWLFLWYYQLPWYDTMILALLALYPASRLDYVVMGQLTAGTFAMMPGGSTFEPPLGWLRTFSHAVWFTAVPIVLLAAVVAVVALAVSGAWKVGPPLARRGG
jgi:alpha-1,6-mannosyltransferase